MMNKARGNMITKIVNNWFKCKIAKYLDKRHSGWCWAELATWGLGYDKWSNYNFKKQTCRDGENFKRYGIGWCGKCKKDNG